MLEDKQGVIYTLCLRCAPKEYIPCENRDREACDACGRTTNQVTYSNTLPDEDNEPATVAARAIIKSTNRGVKLPRRKK